MTPTGRRVGVFRQADGLAQAIEDALDYCGVLQGLSSSTRIALKPNYTYPRYNPGVTTSPLVLRETVRLLRQFTPHLAIVETDGGYNTWPASEAFAGHGVCDLVKDFGIEAVNLCEGPSEMVRFRARLGERQLPLPTRLLHETDLFITMPVPKVHAMTGLSLAYKNQWGCVPDAMRLRRHHVFSDAIVAINRALKPVVLADGTFFLDTFGPMDGGEAVHMGLIIGATDAGSFDRYASELMAFPWRRVKHLVRAAQLGDMPQHLDDITCNVAPDAVSQRCFRLQRTLRSYIALCGFNSRFVTWLGYESWLGRVVLHGILYAIAGRPVKPAAADAAFSGPTSGAPRPPAG